MKKNISALAVLFYILIVPITQADTAGGIGRMTNLFCSAGSPINNEKAEVLYGSVEVWETACQNRKTDPLTESLEKPAMPEPKPAYLQSKAECVNFCKALCSRPIKQQDQNIIWKWTQYDADGDVQSLYPCDNEEEEWEEWQEIFPKTCAGEEGSGRCPYVDGKWDTQELYCGSDGSWARDPKGHWDEDRDLCFEDPRKSQQQCEKSGPLRTCYDFQASLEVEEEEEVVLPDYDYPVRVWRTPSPVYVDLLPQYPIPGSSDYSRSPWGRNFVKTELISDRVPHSYCGNKPNSDCRIGIDFERPRPGNYLELLYPHGYMHLWSISIYGHHIVDDAQLNKVDQGEVPRAFKTKALELPLTVISVQVLAVILDELVTFTKAELAGQGIEPSAVVAKRRVHLRDELSGRAWQVDYGSMKEMQDRFKLACQKAQNCPEYQQDLVIEAAAVEALAFSDERRIDLCEQDEECDRNPGTFYETLLTEVGSNRYRNYSSFSAERHGSSRSHEGRWAGVIGMKNSGNLDFFHGGTASSKNFESTGIRIRLRPPDKGLVYVTRVDIVVKDFQKLVQCHISGFRHQTTPAACKAQGGWAEKITDYGRLEAWVKTGVFGGGEELLGNNKLAEFIYCKRTNERVRYTDDSCVSDFKYGVLKVEGDDWGYYDKEAGKKEYLIHWPYTDKQSLFVTENGVEVASDKIRVSSVADHPEYSLYELYKRRSVLTYLGDPPSGKALIEWSTVQPGACLDHKGDAVKVRPPYVEGPDADGVFQYFPQSDVSGSVYCHEFTTSKDCRNTDFTKGACVWVD